MPRIPGVARKDAGLLIRAGYWFAKRRLGAVQEPFSVLARHRKLFMVAARHEMAAEKACVTMKVRIDRRCRSVLTALADQVVINIDEF